MIPGWKDEHQFTAGRGYNENNWARLLTIQQILGRIYPQGGKEEDLHNSLKRTVKQYCLECDEKSEIYGGCYGADIWVEDPSTQKQILLKSKVSWPYVEDEIRQLHKKNPQVLYWTRPHDPRC